MEQNTEGMMPLFWKIFGGAIIGLVGAMLILIVNSINSNTSTIRSDLSGEIARVKDEVAGIKGQMQVKSEADVTFMKIKEAEAVFVKIKESELIFSKIKEDLAAIKSQIATIEESRSTIKDRISALELAIKESGTGNAAALNSILARNKEIDTQSQELREKLFTQIRELREKVLLLEANLTKKD